MLLVASRLACAAEPDDPAAELASFKIADGFEVSLFASEADGVVKPIQMRFDTRGRLWVIGSSVYPQIEPGQSPNDKVLILEDTTGSGRCNKSTVFADGLMIPTGIEVGDGGAYVGHGTQLLFLRDTNGDGKADEQRIVMRGFGTGDAHQNINSFLWGPGGELWMSQGLHTRSRVETPWGISRLEEAGLWRLRLRRQQLHGFYGSGYEPQNPWGFVFTDWGEPIVLAGNNSSSIYPVPGLVVNHRTDPPALIWKNGNGRKTSGGDIVGTAHFPDAWQGALILGGYINNAVWALKISDDGAGFSLEDRPPLITSSSTSFRPVDAKFGPDGALYICDWYNPIIGHYQASFRDPRRDRAHGRIWRVTATGRPLTKPPQLANASLTQLLDNLKSSDRWTRQFSKRALADRPTEPVVAALKKWIAQPGLTDHDLMEALGVFQSHEVIEPQLLAKLCRALNPGARAYAAGVVGSWADRLDNPLALLRPLVADENPRVRLQAVVACTYIPRPEAIEVAVTATDFPTDKFLTYALNQAVFALKPYWLAAFKQGKLAFDNKPSRVTALLRADGTPDTLQAVRELVQSPQLDAPARATFLRNLADIGDANDLAMILNLRDPQLLAALATAARVRGARPTGDLAATVTDLLNQDNVEMRIAALDLAAAWKLDALRSAVESFAADATKPRIQVAAIGAIASFDPDAAATRAAAILSGHAADADANELFSAFLKRQNGSAALAKALHARTPSADAAKIGLRAMSATGRRDEALAALLADASGFNRDAMQLSPEQIASLSAEVRAQGNAARGAEVFRRSELNCAACHAVDGKGGNIGPNLSALGTAQPIDFIIGAVLSPQKEVKEGYIAHEINTKDGESYLGYILREDNQDLVLRDIARNEEVRLRKDTITSRVQRGSVMPPGLVDPLTRAEFRDLIRYLSELGKAKP